MGAPHRQRHVQRSSFAWSLLGGLLLVLTAAIGWLLSEQRSDLEAAERERLRLYAWVVSDSIAHQLADAHSVLGGSMPPVVEELTANLNPKQVDAVMRSVLSTPDMWVALADARGAVLRRLPGADHRATEAATAPNLSADPQALARVVQQAVNGPGSEALSSGLVVARAAQSAAELSLDRPPWIVVGRDEAVFFAGWRREAAAEIAGLLLLTAISVLAFWAYQRRQHELARLSAERERERDDGARRLKLALDGADLGQWEWQLPSDRVIVDERYSAMLGLATQALGNDTRQWRSHVHSDDWPRVQAAMDAHLRGDATAYACEYRIRHREGHWIWVADRGQIFEHDARGAPIRLVGTYQDISAQRSAAERLHESQALMTMAGELARIGGWSYEVATGKLVLSAEVRAIHGWTEAADFDLERGFDFYVPEYRDLLRQRFDDCLQHGVRFDEELEMITGLGMRQWMRVIGQAVRDAGGSIVRLHGALQDISERKLAEQHTRRLATSLTKTLSSMTDAFVMLDPDWHLTYLNPEALRLARRPREDLLGKQIWDAFPGIPGTVFEDQLRRSLGTQTPVDFESYFEPARAWFEVRIYPSDDGLVVYYRDVTDRKLAEAERRALEDQLRESQKMESIGTLAGGIAHDFNNILGSILGNVTLAIDELDDRLLVTARLQQIRKAGLRARDLVQKILAFSRRQPQTLVPQSLAPLVEETIGLLRATLPATARLEPRIDSTALVLADATQVQQVLMNLGTNAWHALQGRAGRIELGLNEVTLDVAEGQSLGRLPAGHYVHLWVRDSGVGMDTTTCERIFEPFFTTKPVGQGTGLGLSAVHGIVKAHGGAISVDSEPGEGSTFHLYFPTLDAGASPVEPVRPPLAPARAPVRVSGQRVLYVDDDETMRPMVEALLQRAGYQVKLCSSGAAAIALLEAGASAFDVLVTDHNMPDMTGIDLTCEALRRCPGLPVVISTGYISDELAAQASRAGVRHLLHKENTVEELCPVLGELLAGARALP